VPKRLRSYRPIITLECAVIASGAGNGIAMVAIPWLVLERTGQPIVAGIVGAATALPLLISSLLSGSLVDIFGRRRISVLSDIMSSFSVISIPLVDRFLSLDLPLLVALVALGAIFDPSGATAREAMIPEAAVSAGWSLERMNGLHEAAWGLAYMIGPGLGGLLIALFDASTTLWATAFCFLFSALLIGTIDLPGVGKPAHAVRPEGIWSGALDGIRFVWGDATLRAMLLVSIALVAIYMPMEGVLLPVLFEGKDAPHLLGIVIMAISGGGVAGSLLYGAIGARFSRHRIFTFSVAMACVAVFGMALLPDYALLLFAAICSGFFWGPVGPMINIATQTRTPPSHRGRVLGVVLSAQYAAGPLGYLLAGPAVQWFGVERAFLLSGAALLAVGAIVPFLSELKQLDSPGPYEVQVTATDLRPPASGGRA